MRFRIPLVFIFALTLITSAQTQQNVYDVVIINGTVYDGGGGRPRRADVGVKGDRIAAVGDLSSAKAATVIDANGLAVAPGFVNMLSWAVDDLVVDGRSLGDIKQGVTTEIFGEGGAMRHTSGDRTVAATLFRKLGQAARNIKAMASAADTPLKRMRRRFVFIYSPLCYSIRLRRS